MDLVGAWLRQLLRAGTAAALVPAAIVGALVVVLVGAGGFSGLGALGQLVAGPEVAEVDRESGTAGGTSSGARDLAPVSPAITSESPPTRRPAAGPPPVTRVAPAPPPPPPPRAPRPNPPPPPAKRPPPVVAPPPPPPPPPNTAPAPARPPTLEERTRTTTEELKEAVDELGTAVGQIVEGLLNALGRMLGQPPPPAQ